MQVNIKMVVMSSITTTTCSLERHLLGEGVAVFDLSPSVGDGDLLSLGFGIFSSSSGISLFSS